MPRIWCNRALLLVVGILVLTGGSAASATPKKHRKRTVKKPPVQQVEQAPAGPVSPSTLEHQPASRPEVSFEEGKLTIVARNSVLSEVLREVKSKTGADVDVPSNASERVVGFFGPGPARDVLASLLNGSHFNYVLLGSPANANALEHVILIAKSGPDEVTPSPGAAAAPAGTMQAQPVQRQVQPQPQPEEAAGEEVTEDAPDADSEQAPQSGEQQSPIQNGQPGIRTPEQLLQELQRQQQQVQQEQQQQPPGTPQGVPQQPR